MNFKNILHDRFVGKGIRNGYKEEDLERFWKKVVCDDSTKCLFPKAHAVGQAIIGWRCAFLKEHKSG